MIKLLHYIGNKFLRDNKVLEELELIKEENLLLKDKVKQVDNSVISVNKEDYEKINLFIKDV